MRRNWNIVLFKAKACLCIALMLNLSFGLIGCGQSMMTMPDGSVRIAITEGDSISSGLRGTAFEGATAIEVNPRTNTFRMIFPDAGRAVSGVFDHSGGQTQISQFSMSRDGHDFTVDFDTASKRMTKLSSTDNTKTQPYTVSWEPPAADPADLALVPLPAHSARPGVEDYLRANADILQIAQQMEESGAIVSDNSGSPGAAPAGNTTSADPGKDTQAAFGPVLAVLMGAGFFASTATGVLVFIIELVVILSLII